MDLRRVGTAIGLLVVAIAGAPGAASAIEAGSVDDFEDMTTQGWGSANSGAANPNPPQNIADPLDAMNRMLSIRSSGVGSAGSRLAALGFGQPWQGDYLAADVVAIELDAINLGSADLFLRLALLMTLDDVLVSVDAFELPAPGAEQTAEWVRHQFSLDLADLECTATCDPDAVLGDVQEVRIISSAMGGTRKGDRIAASVGIDLITAVPEPESAQQGAAALGALMLLARVSHPRCRWRRRSG
jgi:hypothetical protein